MRRGDGLNDRECEVGFGDSEAGNNRANDLLLGDSVFIGFFWSKDGRSRSALLKSSVQ